MAEESGSDDDERSTPAGPSEDEPADGSDHDTTPDSDDPDTANAAPSDTEDAGDTDAGDADTADAESVETGEDTSTEGEGGGETTDHGSEPAERPVREPKERVDVDEYDPLEDDSDDWGAGGDVADPDSVDAHDTDDAADNGESTSDEWESYESAYEEEPEWAPDDWDEEPEPVPDDWDEEPEPIDDDWNEDHESVPDDWDEDPEPIPDDWDEEPESAAPDINKTPAGPDTYHDDPEDSDRAEGDPAAPEHPDVAESVEMTPAEADTAEAGAYAGEQTEYSEPGPASGPAGGGAPAGAGAGGVGTGPGSAPDDQEMPLAVHIEEMVTRLGVVFVVMALIAAPVFIYAEHIINFLWYSFLPGTFEQCPTTSDPNVACPFIYHPLALLFARIKVATLAGFVVAMPVLVYESYLFMRPGLYPRERRYYLASVPTSLILALVGNLFAYFLVLPVLFQYFTGYSQSAADISFSLTETFNLIVMMLGFFALVFQIPLLIMLAIMMGVTSRRWLASKRLYFWGAFATIAFIFSPDPTGMAPILVAATMVFLFEGTLFLLKWTGN